MDLAIPSGSDDPCSPATSEAAEDGTRSSSPTPPAEQHELQHEPSEDAERLLMQRLDRLVSSDRVKERFLGATLQDHNVSQQSPLPTHQHQEPDKPGGAPDMVPQQKTICKQPPKQGGETPTSAKVRTKQVEYTEVHGRLVATKMNAPINDAMKMYNQAKSAKTQPVARWPKGLQLLPHPEFVLAACDHDEMFYKPSPDEEPAPPRRYGPANEGRVVFSTGNATSRWFARERISSYSQDDTVAPFYTLKSEGDDTLLFESRFESGNLRRAARLSGGQEYNLTLQTDLYTTRHTQWFFFRVGNTRKGVTYTFNLVNLMKSDSLYNYGMQPVMYSESAAQSGKGWRRRGFNIKYYRNDTMIAGQHGRYHYSLTFSCRFEEDHDTVYIAHCYPYTYTMLQNYLTSLSQDESRSQYVRQRVLCRTLAGNVCDLLTVTKFGVSQDEMAARKGVVITGRVHPGETQASYMMRGFIDFITGPSEDAATLRENFVFKIVPMLNPDGVIVGNYRCSLAGVDLNRTYKHSVRDLYPTVHSCKMMMQRLARDRPIVVYIDLHGHSRKQNVFVYGCDNKTMPHRLLREKVFPMMMHLNVRCNS